MLGRLDAAGLVSSHTAKERGPAKELYSLTGAGREVLQAWLSDSTLDLTPPRDLFLLQVFFARRAAPGAAAELVIAYREHVAQLLAAWEQQEEAEPEASPLDLISFRFALLRGRATLGWCDETLEVLGEVGS
ncbi:MAG: helix-turn-helix transcriptional regulator [Actinobacteria bacterium]|nr:helix-turn-helix transcriptional regulator [Actinomycetota bacterium]